MLIFIAASICRNIVYSIWYADSLNALTQEKLGTSNIKTNVGQLTNLITNLIIELKIHLNSIRHPDSFNASAQEKLGTNNIKANVGQLTNLIIEPKTHLKYNKL